MDAFKYEKGKKEKEGNITTYVYRSNGWEGGEGNPSALAFYWVSLLFFCCCCSFCFQPRTEKVFIYQGVCSLNPSEQTLQSDSGIWVKREREKEKKTL